MDYETRAIPLLYHKYGDGAVIAKIFTEQLGLKSYSIKRSKSKKSINKISLIDNNCLLYVSGKNNIKRDVQYLNEISLEYPYRDMDFKKKLIRAFISEVLSKTIIDSEKNQELFNYVWQTYIRLDKLDSLSKSFSLIFLIVLCEFLGIYPSDENINFEYFNLNSGEFTKSENVSEKNITGDNLFFFKKIIKKERVSIPNKNLRELMELLFDYYTLHHFDLSNIKSYKIIKSLD